MGRLGIGLTTEVGVLLNLDGHEYDQRIDGSAARDLRGIPVYKAGSKLIVRSNEEFYYDEETARKEWEERAAQSGKPLRKLKLEPTQFTTWVSDHYGIVMETKVADPRNNYDISGGKCEWRPLGCVCHPLNIATE